MPLTAEIHLPGISLLPIRKCISYLTQMGTLLNVDAPNPSQNLQFVFITKSM